jgi:transcriptional regulator with PAS, ATPase and Fis domain
MDEVEKKAILDALAKHGGNRTKAADALGISRKTILNKIKYWGF